MRTDMEYLRSCLHDCGFGEQMTAKCLQCIGEKRRLELLRLLNLQRGKLMDELHTAQRRIDTMDYIIRQIEMTIEEAQL